MAGCRVRRLHGRSYGKWWSRAPQRPGCSAAAHPYQAGSGQLTRAFFAKCIWPRSVFGNTQNKGLRRFTLRGKGKVSMQWKLFTPVHNIEKIAIYAAA
jgi:hypothetical protein